MKLLKKLSFLITIFLCFGAMSAQCAELSVVGKEQRIIIENVKMTETDILKLDIIKSEYAVYDAKTKQMVFDANVHTGKAFRLVHDGKKVIDVISGSENDKTSCVHTIVAFETIQELVNAISILGLLVSGGIQDHIDSFPTTEKPQIEVTKR